MTQVKLPLNEHPINKQKVDALINQRKKIDRLRRALITLNYLVWFAIGFFVAVVYFNM